MRFEAIEAAIKSSRAKKKVPELQAALKAATKLYEDAAADDELRAEIVKTVGAAGRGTRNEDLATAVLHTLADIGDLRAAKYIRPFLRQANKKRAPPRLATAVATASEVPDASLVGPLLKIVATSKTSGIVEDAVQALGKFGHCKRYRKKILTTLVQAAKKVKPGPRPRMRGGQQNLDGSTGGSSTPFGRETGTAARWSALAATVPGALSELTGQDVGGMLTWIDMLKSHKGKLDLLFIDKEAAEK